MSFQSLARFGAPKNSNLKNLDCAANVLCFADSLSFQRERDFAQRMPTTTNDHQNAIGAYFNRTIDPTRKMKFSFLAIALASIASVASGNSIFPEKKSCAENRFACSAPGTSTSSLNTPTSSSLDTTLSIRGGEVIEPSTLSEVDDILMKAAAEGKLVVIDFSATWCGPCVAIAPLFKQLSEQHSNIVFLKVDVDVNPETAAKYQVSAMPTFLFVKRGDVVDKMMGANPTKLQELLEEYA